MIDNKFKIYTMLLSVFFIVTVSITACVRFSPLGQSVQTHHSAGTSPVPALQQKSLAPQQAKVLVRAVEKENLWNAIRAHLALTASEEGKPAVQEQIQWLVEKQPMYLEQSIASAAPYMAYVYAQVVKRNLPAELVLLPIIESGYKPWEVNRASGAAGMWQLMSATGRVYGARQNKSFDGRRDLYTSTNAALDYFIYLRDFFGGDWLLAIAAYNTGEGNVQNAIRHNARHDKKTNFWALPLALETRSYIPRLLALAAIVKNPQKYGVTLPPINAKPYLELVKIDKKSDLTLAHAAKLANIKLSTLQQLNPGVKSSTARLTECRLALPIDRVSLYRKKLAKKQLAALQHTHKSRSKKVPNQEPIRLVKN